MKFPSLRLRITNHSKTPAASASDLKVETPAHKDAQVSALGPVESGTPDLPIETPAHGDAVALPSAPAETKARRRYMPRTFLSLQYESFRYLWFGNLFGSGAQWVQQISISWLIYDMTDSAILLALVNGVRTIPIALIAPVAGVVVDRLDRRKLLIYSQAFLAVVAALFAVGLWLDRVEVWHVFAFTLLIGVGSGVNMTTRQAVIPNVVPRKDLMNAIALSSASFNITRTFGPALGGAIIAALGMVWNFVFQSFLYIGSFIVLFPIRLPRHIEDEEQQRESFGRSFVTGLHYVWSNRPVFSLLILGLVPMLFVFPLQALMPIFAKDVFHMDVKGFAVLLTANGIGSLAGTLALASLGDVRNKVAVMFASLFLVAFTLLAFSFSFSSSLYLSLGILGLMGAATMVFFSLTMTTIQMLITDDMRGRVMSFFFMDLAIIPLGTLIAGALAEVLGGPVAVTVLGTAFFLFILTAFFALPAVRRVNDLSAQL